MTIILDLIKLTLMFSLAVLYVSLKPDALGSISFVTLIILLVSVTDLGARLEQWNQSLKDLDKSSKM